MEGVKDTLRHAWLVIRCSAIGSYTAIIPGMGGATTQWLAYAHAVQSSPDKERFGKGAIEGVLGPGAANNSTMGGSLITTIAFGIPASVMMAILLGAFLIQGLVPGPDMLIPEPKGHLSLTFSFVWTIVLSNIITVTACFLFLNQLVKITYIRSSLVIPFLLLLIYLGAFAEKNMFEDLILVLLFGVLGWVMQRVDWPRPPLILGLVLGPLAENRLFLSTGNYGLAWLLRPGVLILLAITLFGAFFPILRRSRKRREGIRAEPGDRLASLDKGVGWLKRVNNAAIFDFAVMIMFGCALFVSRNFSFRAGLFPWAIGIPVFILANAQFVIDFRLGGRPKPPEEHTVDVSSEIPRDVARRRTAQIFSWIVSFFVAIWLLGFPIGAPLCTFIQLKFGYREKWPITLMLTGFTWIFIYALFERILHVPFPTGWLFGWF
jgi:hypothetical protein